MALMCAGAVSGDSWADTATVDHIPLSEIEAGMTGYGLTVFRGTKVDTFGVTVIGVQKNVRAAGSLLLIEVSGHGLEKSAIAQGMSGSPIYLGGRFAGALAFGWGGALRPIAGVTPAAEMLALPTHIPAVTDGRRLSVRPDFGPLTGQSPAARALAAELWPETSTIATEESGWAGAEPLNTTGWPTASRMWQHLSTQLPAPARPAGDRGPQWILQPLDGAAPARSDGSLPARLVPGGACAVPLVTGDAALGAIGTVTRVDGDQVLMMGHPFLQRGPVALPLATAEVLTLFPSREMSFKMGSVGDVIGTVHHDLRAGLSGRMGPAPRMIPVTVDVAVDGVARTYRFEVVTDPFLTPSLVFWAFYNALLVTGNDAGLQTVRYEIESTWQGPAVVSDQPLRVAGVTAGPGGAAGLAAAIMTPLDAVLNNPHTAVELQEVRARLVSEPELQVAAITGLNSPRLVAAAGSEIEFFAELAPRGGPRESLPLRMTLPEHLTPGPYRVVLASAADLFALETQRAAGRFQPVSLAGIVEVLNFPRSRGELVLALLAPGKATVLAGQELHDLPASVARTVQAGNMQAQRTLADYVLRQGQETSWLLTGHAVRSLRVTAAARPQGEKRRP